MKFIVGKDWRDLFDVVIVQADKPNFFNDKRRWVVSKDQFKQLIPYKAIEHVNEIFWFGCNVKLNCNDLK